MLGRMTDAPPTLAERGTAEPITSWRMKTQACQPALGG
jgi:hypothetical protein